MLQSSKGTFGDPKFADKNKLQHSPIRSKAPFALEKFFYGSATGKRAFMYTQRLVPT